MEQENVGKIEKIGLEKKKNRREYELKIKPPLVYDSAAAFEVWLENMHLWV